MGSTNYFSGIVKLLENPRQMSLKKKMLVTTFRVEVPQIRKNKIISVVFWGNLGRDVKNYYKMNDYILIEGYVSIRNKKNRKLITKSSKTVTVTVLKVYPLVLKSNHTTNEV